jgi:AraC family transcriptional activator of pobA
MRRDNGLSSPEHPSICLHRCTSTCPMGEAEFTTDFYIIGFKKLHKGQFMYGRTKYDHDNGSMSFIKPRQLVELRNIEVEEDGFFIFIHEDYLNGHTLHDEITKYGFFDYEANEALHLSPREEGFIWNLYNLIDVEYQNNPDEYSRNIMLTHIDSILKYAQRFYRRQFVNRLDLSGKMASKFDQLINAWFSNGFSESKGMPTVNILAAQLNVSSRYLSDLLKQETGKSAIELIHLHLIGEAKDRLKRKEMNISEIAFELGFDSLSYFSRLFKKETGHSPNEFKKLLN